MHIRRSALFLVLGFVTCTYQVAFGQLSVQEVTINGEKLSYKPNEALHLPAMAEDVIFTFTKGDSRADYYQYKLDGFDREWISSPYPVARYTNLSGKEYVLSVRSIANRRIASRLSIPVSVEMELTEEWWFIPSLVVYILALAGAGMYFFILYNFRQKLKVQAIRSRIAADLHDEVGATLSSIAFATNMVQRKLDGRLPDVESILSNIKADSEETIHSIRDTVWAISPDNDSQEKLFEKMRSHAFQVLTARNIDLLFDNQVREGKSLKINMEQRRNLYLIFKEAINNIAKHSRANRARVLIAHSREGFYMRIEDDGAGFSLNGPSTGNGLRNFRARAAESLIDLEIDSSPGQGTRLKVTIPEL